MAMLRNYNVQEEERIKEFWLAHNIPDKVREKNADSGKSFYFMDGPPYATGHIHMGTALNKILKDVVMRAKRMQGFYVFDRPGYDTHGLPIENKVEKKLGIKHKQEIEEFGIANFVEECRKFATIHIEDMNKEFLDLGVWMDWKDPYLTLTQDYIEAIWWTFKKAEQRGMLYLGKYPVHVCPRCETAVAYNEIEYTKLTDEAIYVKFPLVDKPNTFLIIWTTTPWTLPGNTGVMVHPEFEYVFAKLSNNETWIVAKELLQELMDVIEAGYTIEKVVKGKELEGLRYKNPLAKHLALPELKDAYRVILSERYVTLEQGTGLVHTAPGHGKEDYDAGTKAKLPVICPVALDGTLTEDAGKYAGKKARVVDAEIIEDLEKDGFLVYRHAFTHDYPICWRCKTPLLMLATPQWFLKIGDIRSKLIEESEKVDWIPEWMKARMRNWLESLADWPISRQRYWGAPIPIWVCERCNRSIVIGSAEELKKAANLSKLPDLHRPYIDEVTIKCDCGGVMHRIPEVFDVWFDSGVSSWAALGYPKDDKLFKKFWPADLNIEGTDQVRGWWNSQIITSYICFDTRPYKSIVAHGMVLDVSKKKMSKSLGNVVTPKDVITKYSRDHLRYYLIKMSRGNDILFSWNEFKDISRFFNIFLNLYNFASMYLDLDLDCDSLDGKELKVEDRWLLSRYNRLIKELVKHYNSYRLWNLSQALERFVIEDFSRTYIKLVRERIANERKLLSNVFSYVLSGLLRVLSPVVPHATEFIFQQLKKTGSKESIHMYEFPEVDSKLIDDKLEESFEKALAVVQACLAFREELKFRRRWPLKRLVVVTKTGKELQELLPLLKVACNMLEVEEAKEKQKGLTCKDFEGFSLCLDTTVSEDLKQEWEFRELVRRIQAMRKEKGLTPEQRVVLEISCSDPEFVKKFASRIEKETNTQIKPGKGKLQKLLERSFYINIIKK
jgi:isoleucyl-tRNA synthetase